MVVALAGIWQAVSPTVVNVPAQLTTASAGFVPLARLSAREIASAMPMSATDRRPVAEGGRACVGHQD